MRIKLILDVINLAIVWGLVFTTFYLVKKNMILEKLIEKEIEEKAELIKKNVDLEHENENLQRDRNYSAEQWYYCYENAIEHRNKILELMARKIKETEKLLTEEEIIKYYKNTAEAIINHVGDEFLK